MNDNFPSTQFHALGAPAARGIRTGQTLSHTLGLTGSRRHGATRGARVLQNEAGASVTGARRSAEPRTTRGRGRPVRTSLHLRRPREPGPQDRHARPCAHTAVPAPRPHPESDRPPQGEPPRNDARRVLRSVGPARARLQPQRITSPRCLPAGSEGPLRGAAVPAPRCGAGAPGEPCSLLCAVLNKNFPEARKRGRKLSCGPPAPPERTGGPARGGVGSSRRGPPSLLAGVRVGSVGHRAARGLCREAKQPAGRKHPRVAGGPEPASRPTV